MFLSLFIFWKRKHLRTVVPFCASDLGSKISLHTMLRVAERRYSLLSSYWSSMTAWRVISSTDQISNFCFRSVEWNLGVSSSFAIVCLFRMCIAYYDLILKIPLQLCAEYMHSKRVNGQQQKVHWHSSCQKLALQRISWSTSCSRFKRLLVLWGWQESNFPSLHKRNCRPFGTRVCKKLFFRNASTQVWNAHSYCVTQTPTLDFRSDFDSSNVTTAPSSHCLVPALFEHVCFTT